VAEATWDAFSESYDTLTIVIGNTTFEWRETLVEVDGSAGGARWDVKEAPGYDGALIRYRGQTAGRASVAWQLWKAEHEIAWQAFYAAAAPKAGKVQPPVVWVLHPLLMFGTMAGFVVNDFSLPKRVEPGIYRVSLSLTQWFNQPKESPKKPTATASLASIPVAAGLAPKVPPPPSADPKKTAP
jgi:hypothetical protein